MKWARKKALRSDETKKRPANPNAMDVDSGGAKALGERNGHSSSRPYTNESEREEAGWYGWQGHVDVFGKGYKGKGKGSWEKGYRPIQQRQRKRRRQIGSQRKGEWKEFHILGRVPSLRCHGTLGI